MHSVSCRRIAAALLAAFLVTCSVPARAQGVGAVALPAAPLAAVSGLDVGQWIAWLLARWQAGGPPAAHSAAPVAPVAPVAVAAADATNCSGSTSSCVPNPFDVAVVNPNGNH